MLDEPDSGTPYSAPLDGPRRAGGHVPRHASGGAGSRSASSPAARFYDDGDDQPTPSRGRPRRVADRWRFPASIGWTTLSAVIPGAGLIRTRWRPLGLLMVLALVVSAAFIGFAAVFAPATLLEFAFKPSVLAVLSGVVAGVGVLWAFSIAATHLLLRPKAPSGWQRLLGSVVVGVLTLAVAAPTFVGARTLWDTNTLIAGVFVDPTTNTTPDGTTTPQETFGNAIDPWANKARLNVLVLGGDSGQSRAESLGARTDTVILASIDTKTGQTILFALPRQTQRMPFPAGSKLAARWPQGFTNGSESDLEFALNAMYHNLPAMSPEAMPTGVKDPAAEALKLSVGAALGVKVDYYTMINMDGFIEFINALGGITVNINKPVAVGGVSSTNTPPDRWLPPGPDQHLNGMDALWFARGRYGAETGDYERMARQRCVIQAVAKQANPTRVLANYEALAKAGRNIVATDVPNTQLPALLTLAGRVRDQQMRSVAFVHDVNGFSTVRPNWTLVRQQVQAAIAPVSATPASSPSSAAPTATASGKATPSRTPTASASGKASESATPSTPAAPVDECAYNPVAS